LDNSNVFNELLKRYHEGKLAHAFLFETNDVSKCYEEIIGFVKRMLCPLEYNDNCDKECNICELVDTGNLPSLITIEPDGQFIKKGQILNVMDKFSTKPVFADYNIYIVKNAECFNSSSANTLLKFLEEPEDNILGFFITNNKENVISTVRSRCQIYNCIYLDEINNNLDEDLLIDVKLYLNSIYKNKDDLLYNKTHMSGYYADRQGWEKFFTLMLYYMKDCYLLKRKDVIEMLKDNDNVIKMILLVEEVLKYIRSNGNIDLILDKFVIEMRNYYE